MVTARTQRRLVSVPDEHPDTLYTRIPPPQRFEEMRADFLRAKDLESIATLLIDAFKVEFAHLKGFTVGYAWKRKGGESSGNATFGKTVKTSGLVKFYSDCDFVIWLAADHMREMEATFWQIEALLFHGLLHTGAEDSGKEGEEPKPALRGHDFEGFAKEVTKYGAWDESAKIMRNAFEQLRLNFDDGDGA